MMQDNQSETNVDYDTVEILSKNIFHNTFPVCRLDFYCVDIGLSLVVIFIILQLIK